MCVADNVLTTPACEWTFLVTGVWRSADRQSYTGPELTAPGAFSWEGEGEQGRWVEDEQKRRQHIAFDVDSLHANLAARMNGARDAWEREHPTAGGAVLVSEEAVRGTLITRLELMVTCGYTGPLYSLYNTGALHRPTRAPRTERARTT